MLNVVGREWLYFTTALGISYGATRAVGNPNQSAAALLVGILIPAAICLTRAALVKSPPRDVSAFRRALFQVLMGAALVCLLVCDVVVGLILGYSVSHMIAWAAVSLLGVMYIFFFCLAQWIGFGSIQ